MLRVSTILILTIGLMTACGDTHDDHDHHLGEEACLHMLNGPASALAAGGDEASATDTEHSDWEHKRVDLTLVEQSGSFTGFIKLEIDDAGDYSFFASNKATLKINGESPESSQAEDECSGITHFDVFELTVGEHILKVTAAEATIQLVIEGSEEGHDDH